MTLTQIKTAKAIADTLKKDPLIAHEVKNHFEKPEYLFNALGISAGGSEQLVPTLNNQKIY